MNATTISMPDLEEFTADVPEEVLADSSKSTDKGEPPVMEDHPDLFVDLPRGIWRDSVWERRAEVKELTGMDEEFISKYNKTETEAFDAVLSVGVTRIGSLDLSSKPHTERVGILNDLMVGERQALYIAITRVTFGNEREFTYVCECLADVETSIDMAKDLKISEPVGVDLTAGLYEYKSPTSNLVVEFRLVTGSDEKIIMEKKSATMPERVSMVLENVIKRVNGGPVVDPYGFVRNMKSRDRKGLMEVIDSYQPKVDMEVEIECPSCSRKTPFALSWSDLFQ